MGMTLNEDIAGRLDEVVPLEPAAMAGRNVIQWDKDDCADLGIIKVDLLGLGMMAVLEDSIPLIREHEGAEIDYAKLPADDPKVYDMLQRADTIGVFQVESRAQMTMLPRLKPREFYDLVIEVAIVRPGPIQGGAVNPYIARSLGYEAVTFDHPALEDVLAETKGVFIFQEQVLQAAMAIAGFTPGQAETLRRAMSRKRSHDALEAYRGRFVEGAATNGVVLTSATRGVSARRSTTPSASRKETAPRSRVTRPPRPRASRHDRRTSSTQAPITRPSRSRIVWPGSSVVSIRSIARSFPSMDA